MLTQPDATKLKNKVEKNSMAKQYVEALNLD